MVSSVELEASLDVAVVELDELVDDSDSSLACFVMLPASARTFSSSPAHGKLLAQYAETSFEALVISPMALLTAFAVHFDLHVAAILRFSSSVACIAACYVSISDLFFSIAACSTSFYLISSLVLMV